MDDTRKSLLAVLRQARRDELQAGKVVFGTERGYVDGLLRGIDKPKLTDQEVHELAIGEAHDGRPDRAAAFARGLGDAAGEPPGRSEGWRQLVRGLGLEDSAPLADAIKAALWRPDHAKRLLNLPAGEADEVAIETAIRALWGETPRREKIIAASRACFARTRETNRVACSERTWVGETLRLLGMPCVTENEFRELGFSVE